jgi:hypothetical protein
VQSPKKVKHRSRPVHAAARAGIALAVLACAAFSGAYVMCSVNSPSGWQALAVVAGFTALGMSGLSFIADLAKTRADRQAHTEER